MDNKNKSNIEDTLKKIESKLDTIMLFLILITIIIFVILGSIGFFYLEFHNIYGNSYISY